MPDHSNQTKADDILHWIWLWNEEVSPDRGGQPFAILSEKRKPKK
jgi:hypothetical protein